MSMNTSYVKDIPVARQWDIILQVTRFGDCSPVIKLVEAGYSVTVELLELLYRMGANNVIERIIPYDEDIYYDVFLQGPKMKILEEALGKSVAVELRKTILNKRSQEKKNEEKQKQDFLLSRLKELHETFGLTDAFFDSIRSSNELMALAATTYDRKTVALGLAKYADRQFYSRNFTVFELAEYGMYDKALDSYTMFCDYNERIQLIKQIAQTEEGFNELVTRANYVDGYRETEYLGVIAKDTAIRERLKSCGYPGYNVLYNSKIMTVEEFEECCKLEPEMVVFYKQFKKSIFWVIKNGYFKYLKS